MSHLPIDSRQFRNALGSFATGVTIVTTCAQDGSPVGLTASSFNSLSLEPPMVLWALAKSSLSLPAFVAAEYFAVHILASDQQPLADRFATRGTDKFAGLEFDTGPRRIPLLRGCSARFQCRTAHQYDGGDHTIFVGQVIGFDHFDRSPLAFQGGAYANLVPRPRGARAAGDRSPATGGSFSSDFLGYLLGSAHARLMSLVRGELERHQLAEEQYHALMCLSNEDDLTLAELVARAQLAGRPVTDDTIAALAARHLVALSDDAAPATRARLTADGRRTALELGVALKAAEAHAERLLGEHEAQALKMLLQGLLTAMPPATPSSAPDAPPPAAGGR